MEVPQYYPSVHQQIPHFCYSFAFDAPTVWNDLPEEVSSAETLACFRKKCKISSMQVMLHIYAQSEFPTQIRINDQNSDQL